MPHTETARALAEILDHYDALLSELGLIEPGEAVRLLAQDPPRCADLIAVNRFADLSAQQERLLVALARVTDVRIALTWEEGFPACEALDDLVGRLSDQGKHVHVQAPQTTNELGLLEAALFRSESRSVTPEGQLLLCEVSGEEAEQSSIADIVAEQISAGTQAGRIVVVFRDASSRAESLCLQLAQRGVEADVDVSVLFSSTGFGRALLALLDVCSGRERTAARLLDFLLSPYAGVDYRAASQLDSEWRASRVEGERLVASARALGGTVGKILSLGVNLGRTGLTCGTAIELQRIAGTMLSASGESVQGCGPKALDAAAHRVLLTVAGELLETGEDTHRITDLGEAVRRRKVASGRADRAEAVQITEADRIRSRRFDVVVVGGLTADEFSSDRGTDSLNGRLEELGLPVEREESLSERLLFYLVATRAREKLVLVRQTSDSEGEARRPSVFWDDVREIYGETSGDEQSSRPIPRRVCSLADLAVSAPAFSPGRQSARSAVISRLRRAEGLRDAEVLARLAERDEFSVTELESYIACPRRWFYEHALSPRELDTRFDARASGTLAHKALASFYERWRVEAGHERVTEGLLDEALVLLDETLETVSRVRAVGLAERLVQTQVREWVRGVVRADARLWPGFAPVAHEFVFGKESGRPVDVGQGVLLRGRIDRIDQAGTQAMITDYKSRHVKGWRSFDSAGLVQVPIYAHVASQLLGVSVVGGLYRSLAQGVMRGFWNGDVLDSCAQGNDRDKVTPEEMDHAIAAAMQRVREAALGIRAGEIPACAGIASACTFCMLRTVCEGAR